MKSNFRQTIRLYSCLHGDTWDGKWLRRPLPSLSHYIHKHNQGNSNESTPGNLRGVTSSSFNFRFYSLELGLALKLLFERFAGDPGLALRTAVNKFSLYIYTAFQASDIFLFNRKIHIPTNHTVRIFEGGFTTEHLLSHSRKTVDFKTTYNLFLIF